MTQTEAIAILADVKGSRRRSDRVELSNRLPALLKSMNDRFSGDTSGAFDVMKGIDEFGALLRSATHLGEILLTLWQGLHPIPVRFSIAKGGIDVFPAAPSDTETSVRSFDGPAFHMAADMLNNLSGSGRHISIAVSSDGNTNAAHTFIADLIYTRLLRTTARQLEVLMWYRRLHSQAEVAEHLGIRQSSVSQSLRSIDGHLLLQAFDYLETQFRSL